MRDLETEYVSFQKTAVAGSVLLGQLGAVLVAVFLCSTWWHYVLLALLCFATLPAFVGFFSSAISGWWERHVGSAMPPEHIEETYDALDATLPKDPGMPRSWPFKKSS